MALLSHFITSHNISFATSPAFLRENIATEQYLRECGLNFIAKDAPRRQAGSSSIARRSTADRVPRREFTKNSTRPPPQGYVSSPFNIRRFPATQRSAAMCRFRKWSTVELVVPWPASVFADTPDRVGHQYPIVSRSRQFDGCEIEIIDGLPDWSSRTCVETAGTGTGNPRRSPW